MCSGPNYAELVSTVSFTFIVQRLSLQTALAHIARRLAPDSCCELSVLSHLTYVKSQQSFEPDKMKAGAEVTCGIVSS